MVTLKMIEEAINEKGLNKQDKEERIKYYKELILEMLNFSIKELDGLKDERKFFIEHHKKDFMNSEIRKIVNGILENVNEASYSCLKEINHYRELKEIIKSLANKCGG